MAFISIHELQIIPFALDSTCVDERVGRETKGICKGDVTFLHAAERESWHHLMIGDESWFFLSTSLHRM
jgi:hypothetical protein